MASSELRAIDVELDDLAARASALVQSLRTAAHKVDRFGLDELRAVEDFVGKTRAEIVALAPVAISQRRIPQAGAELSAIVRESGEATNRILTAAEALLTCSAPDFDSYRALVADHAVEILEACGFHDLTGQRVSKVVEGLNVIEARTRRFATELGVADTPDAESDVETHDRENLLNGPSTNGADQTLIDDVFAGATLGGSE